MDYGDIFFSGDGIYQMWVLVEFDFKSSNFYFCYVEYCGVYMVFQVFQELEIIFFVMKVVFGFIIFVIVLVGVGVLVWRRRF